MKIIIIIFVVGLGLFISVALHSGIDKRDIVSTAIGIGALEFGVILYIRKMLSYDKKLRELWKVKDKRSKKPL